MFITMQYFFKVFLTFIITISIYSCSLPKTYEVVIRQGNIIEAEMVEKLEVGMTESQVRFVLGSPLVRDTFESDIWIYQSRVSQGEKIYGESELILYFNEGKLLSWVGDFLKEEIDSKLKRNNQ